MCSTYGSIRQVHAGLGLIRWFGTVSDCKRNIMSGAVAK